MSHSIEIVILGSGTSQGVPVIACDCHVCTSNDSKDKRLRCSVMITYNGENYVIDAGPDFRSQMLRENVKSLRAVMFTHEHKDHMSGLDDVRAFNYKESRDMEVYCSKRVEKALHREYHYVFSEERYPGIPMIHIETIEDDIFSLPGGLDVQPINVMHYQMPVKAFRIKDFTYITDAKTIEKEEIEKIKGTRILVVNALRVPEHISHFNLQEALDLIQVIKPEIAYLTHISHLFGTHEDILKLLPENVYPAYDGLRIRI